MLRPGVLPGLCATLVAAAGACGSRPAEPPLSSPLLCGVETQQLGEGYDKAARDCLWESFREGRRADLTLTFVSREEKTEYRLLVVSKGRLRISVRSPRQSAAVDLECRSLAKQAVPGHEERYGFVAGGCRGGASPVVDIP